MTDKQKNTQHIKLFAGPEHPCGYLEGETSVSLFADPTLNLNNGLYSQLSRLGFRRSGDHIYRPRCPNCSACWTYRVIADEFAPNKAQRRILKANQDLQLTCESAKPTHKDYKLYEQYINLRHRDGDMYPTSFQQFEEFLFSNWCESIILRANNPKGETEAIMHLDLLDDGLSAVYSYFKPDSDYKSLGTYLILETIELCHKQQLSFIYLGYFIESCNKMSYKQQFRPAEVYKNNHWQRQEKA